MNPDVTNGFELQQIFCNNTSREDNSCPRSSTLQTDMQIHHFDPEFFHLQLIYPLNLQLFSLAETSA